MGDPQTATSYEVIGKLADGDVAELFLAKAAAGAGAMERLVVVKRIPRKVTQNVELVKSFLDEAAIAARLQHPNIAQVFEVGKLGGSYFFAMEYINGETLRSLVEHARSKKIQVPIRSVVTIAAGAAAGLHHAHQRNGINGNPLNIVHADISPTNVLVTREGIVKLVDFGIAKARGQAHTPTAPDKVSYWSPEQCRGEALDRRSDLYSLGVALWELITLEDLFHRGGDAKTRAAIENEEAPPPSARRYDVPPELDVIIQRLLAKKKEDRYKDADDVLAALEGLASKLGFQLSTAELARMMRLWFGNVPDPVIGPSDKPLVVKSEPVPATVTAPAADPIDALLESVRSATDIIRAASAALGNKGAGNAAVPSIANTVETNREDFQAVRDRILADARKKKETKAPPMAAAAAGASAATPAAAAEATGGRAKRETLNSSNNAYSFITNVSGKAAEPIRNVTTPPLGTALATAAGNGSVAVADAGSRPGAPTGPNTASATEPAARTERGQIGPRTATFEAVADVSINDAVGLTSAAMAAAATKSVEVSSDAAREAADAAKAEADKAEAAKAEAAKAEADKAEAAKAAKAEADKAEAAAKAEAALIAQPAAKPDKAAAAKTDNADAKTDKGREAPPAEKRNVRAESPRAAVASESDDDDDTSLAPKRPGWIVPAALAAVAIVVVIVIMKMKGGGEDKPKNTEQQGSQVAMAPADAAAQVVEPPPVVVDAAVAMATPDAAEVIVPIDAAEVAATPVDAAVVATAPPDAAVKERPDAAVKERPDAAVRERPDAAVKERPDAAVKEPAVEKTIEDMVAAGEFTKANKACKSNTIFNSARLTSCTIAACQSKDQALAQRWIRAIEKSARADLVKTCTALGVTVSDPSAPAPTPAP